MREIAPAHSDQQFFLYLGRHIGLPVCLEGALKLKEISYIPTDAYAAGEMKHGPIALLDESTPVVCVATDSPVLDKVLSNVEEVRARGAETIAIATEGSERVAEVADQTIEVARTDWILQPILAILPLQLLAYYIARAQRPQRRPAAQPGEDGHAGPSGIPDGPGCSGWRAPVPLVDLDLRTRFAGTPRGQAVAAIDAINRCGRQSSPATLPPEWMPRPGRWKRMRRRGGPSPSASTRESWVTSSRPGSGTPASCGSPRSRTRLVPEQPPAA